ncbi:MAG: cbb3-type cytochrome c oxidase subunit II [Verrucomicrobiota bacterium]
MKSLNSFLIPLSMVFALPWAAFVVIPWLYHAKDFGQITFEEEGKELVYPPTRTGVAMGAQVYARNGCAYCHTQMVRPTYAGADLWRSGWGGDEEEGTTRSTRPRDYLGERFAYLGYSRNGPDLSNVGIRIQDVQWHHDHLFDPRSVVPGSIMPSFRNLYRKRRVLGLPSDDAVKVIEEEDGTQYEFVPSTEAQALVSYLLSMRKDSALPPQFLAASSDAETPEEGANAK